MSASFQRFDIRVPLGQVIAKLDELVQKRPLPKPAGDLLSQLEASLAVRGIALPANSYTGHSYTGEVHARVARTVATEEGLIELCNKLNCAIDSLLSPAEFDSAGIANILSPSQYRTWSDCQAKWMFKYLHELPDPPNSNLALGKAVHAAIAENYRQKVETRADISGEAVGELFRQAWAAQREETIFRPEEDPGELGRMGEFMVQQYISQAAPLIQPAVVERDGQRVPAVELEISGEIAGVRVRGRIDVMAEDGTIDDVKTAAKSPSGIADDRRFQLATYTQLLPGASGRGRIDTLVKTKSTKLVSQTFDISAEDLRRTAVAYPLARDAMRAGYYSPNRNSMLCSRRNCPFWRACEKEFGGTVEET
jgi:hypothetical protein